jgi:hypothetical protein
MAKKKFADELDAELRADADLRTVRQHEKEVAQLKGKLAQSEQKRKQAEADLVTAQEQVEFKDTLIPPKPTAIDRPPCKASGSATAVIVLGDWHVEETVDPSTIDGKNEYNLAIAEKRIKSVFTNAVELIECERGLSGIKDIVLAVLGDMITGQIHDELAEGNSLSPTEACLFFGDLLCGGISYLLKHSGCRTITIPTCYGNHGRTTAKPRIATAYKHSFEWLQYHHLAAYYKNEPRVTWKIEKSYFNYLDIQGKLNRFQHGDWLRYGGGVMGLGVPVNKAINEWNKTQWAAFDWFQHWHQNISGERFWGGNCVIGYNAYAQSIKAGFSQPSQTLAVIDKKQPLPVVIRKIFCN